MARFRGPKQIVVFITPEVYAKAGNYMDNGNCPIAAAIKMRFPNCAVRVGGMDVDIYPSGKAWTGKGYNYEIVGSCSDYDYIMYGKNQSDCKIPILLELAK